MGRGGAVGTRDLAHLRALAGIVFNWGVDPLLGRIVLAWPTKTIISQTGASRIIDLTTTPEDYSALRSMLSKIAVMLFPRGLQDHLSQTHVTSILLNRHVTSVFKAGIALGWLPKSSSSESTPVVHHFRPLVMRLLVVLQPSQAIAALGGVLQGPPSPLPHVRRTCLSLLNRQLIRKGGVRGLCESVLGEEEMSGEEAPLEKLERISDVIRLALPENMPAEAYYENVVSQLIHILSTEASSPVHQRAAGFALSRLFSRQTEATASEPTVIRPADVALPLVHEAFLAPADSSEAVAKKEHSLTPSQTISVLVKLLRNTDPSPTLVSDLLSPIVPPMYAIYEELEKLKAGDPERKESIRNLLATWGKLVNASLGVSMLWRIVNGDGGNWKVDITGEIARTHRDEGVSSQSIFTPTSLDRAQRNGDLDMDANIFDLRPDPRIFVRFVKSLDRSDISTEVLIEVLKAYQGLRSSTSADPFRVLLFLQLATQMQQQLSDKGSASSLLQQPGHILSFVKQAIETAVHRRTVPPPDTTLPASRLTLEDLRIVDNVHTDVEDEKDSDDEAPDSSTSIDEEMMTTAINLLLSVLEARAKLPTHLTANLEEIFELLEPAAASTSDALRPLAREARIVITARLASTSAFGMSSTQSAKGTEEDPQGTYQKALKLLQDPLLPVRAHGLMLLRELVSRRAASASSSPAIDRALKPAILSIFLQSIQDDDSYIYLNAVNGLSSMVDGYGKDVLNRLRDLYADGLDGLAGSAMTQADLDQRLRVGEVLEQVIRRCGNALPAYADLLVPTLLHVAKTPQVPTALRTSSLSLLSQCAQTSAIIVVTHLSGVLGMVIDVLQTEAVSANLSSDSKHAPSTKSGVAITEAMDLEPTSGLSKLPPLRRAAVHLCHVVLRASLVHGDDSLVTMLDLSTVRRLRITLTYTASTDEDAVVRMMANEALDAINQFQRSLLGF
ncbi:hypothetical protein PUNSTDRAFT_112574 [Punctularia strigosozonata HHB-11173 SS5]|uniref:uncharacterized protein n=1 Tax=Punctularia strigosozonata (strain HHB-11173) TaxID=741275 RepID=UPI0004417285|nr:uncharacterized protein PUNSTDRAFT_112574 [Punctularia strigosozonata HHB-11173 SS5]EIN10764.1 hypothetical protein PUNSTDRAFT_112574 [Punctularia strigosozonata HHB-11173 SS5]